MGGPCGCPSPAAAPVAGLCPPSRRRTSPWRPPFTCLSSCSLHLPPTTSTSPPVSPALSSPTTNPFVDTSLLRSHGSVPAANRSSVTATARLWRDPTEAPEVDAGCPYELDCGWRRPSMPPISNHPSWLPPLSDNKERRRVRPRVPLLGILRRWSKEEV